MDEAGKSSGSSVSMERSHETAPMRKAMHDAIDRGNFGDVEKCLNENKDLRQWLDPETEKSALRNALKKKELKISALLVSRSCRFNEANKNKEGKLFMKLTPLEKSEYHYQLRLLVHTCDPIQRLLCKSSSKTSDMFETKVKELYEKLYEIPMVDTILRVVATSLWLEVTFDFHSNRLVCMLGNDYRATLGVTMLREEQIYLAAKMNDDELLGTMAHEFCHAALGMVYENNGKPFEQNDGARRNHYQRILNEIEPGICKMHDVIAQAFHNTSVKEEELVVRVPHLLALMRFRMHGTHEAHMPSGEALLQEQVPKLFGFFRDIILPDMEEFISKNRPEKDRQQIREQNQRLGKADKIRSLGIEFKTKLDLQDYPLLVLTAPNLSFLEIMIYDAVTLKRQSYVFLELKNWDGVLEEALLKNKCSYVIISSGRKHYRQGKRRNANTKLLKDLATIRGTKVIVLTENAEHDNFVEEINDRLGNRAHVLAVSNCTLSDVTDKCKADSLKLSYVRLQDDSELSICELMASRGERGHVNLEELTGDRFSDVLDENTFLKLCREKTVDVGPKLKTLDKHIASYYVERTCERVTQVDLSLALRTLTNEAFAIVGSCGKILDALVPPGCHASRHSQVKRFERCVLLDNADDYDTLSQFACYEEKTVHLLQYDSQSSEFHWVRSNGPLGPLREAVSGTCKVHDMEALIRDVPGKVMVICGDPGMGKSVMSLRMAQHIKTMDKMAWVLHVDLQKIDIQSVDCSTVGDMVLAKFCGLKQDTFEFNLLKRSISSGWPFKVVVIFDAFDEVVAQVRKFLMELVVALRKTMISKIFLFGRNCFKPELQNKFNTIAFEIVGFRDEEQVQYLKRFWKRNGRKIDDEKLDSCARRSLGRFSSQWNDKLTKNPLLVHMIAEIDEARVEHLEQGNPEDEKPVHAEKYSTLNIYEEFVETKLTIYQKKQTGGTDSNKSLIAVQDEKVKTRSSLYEDHGLLALKVVFNQELLAMLLSKKELRNIEPGGTLMKRVVDGYLKHGLIDGHNKGIPVFVHRTFAEFFAACFLANEVTEEADAAGRVTKIVASMYRNIDYDGILNFFDALGAKSHALHCHVMNNDWRSVENLAEVPFSRDGFLRSPVHIAALHAGEVILVAVTRKHGKQIAEELLEEDGLGMTPLMYADSKRDWQRVNVFCTMCSEKSVNWAKQLPVSIKNIREERDFAYSVILHVVLWKCTELFNCLLKACSDLKTAERPLVSDTQEMRHGQVTKEPVIDVDAIKCDFEHTPIFHATSYEVFKVLLPHSDIRALAKHDSTLLHVYAAVGAHDACKYVLNRLPSDAPNADGQTPLHMSIIHGNADTVDILIPHAATKDACDKRRNTALHLAAVPDSISERGTLCNWLLGDVFCSESSTSMHGNASVVQTEVMEKILPHVATTVRNCDGDTALHESSNSVFVSSVMLLLPYSDVDVKNNTGETPLLSSVSGLSFDRDMINILGSEDGSTENARKSNTFGKEDIKITKLLLPHSLVNAADEDDRTALDRSVRRGKLDVVKLLFPHFSANSTDKHGRTLFHWAVIMGHLDVVSFFLPRMCINVRDDHGATPLIYSALYGHNDIVKVLLPLVSTDVPDTSGLLPLHYSARRGHTDIVEFLLPHSFASKCAEHGSTTLHLSAREGRVETLKVILPHSDAVICDDGGDTAIHVSTYGLYYDVVQLLLPYSEVDASNKLGKTSFLRACCDSDQRQQESPAGCSGSSSMLGTRNVKIIKLLLLHSVGNATDVGNCTPLHLSARGGNLDVVKLMFPQLPANDTDKRGRSALHWAVIMGHLDVVNFFLPRMCINVRDDHGATPLIYSALYGHIDIVKVLLPVISADVPDTSGLIPLHYSASEGYIEVVEFLLPHSFDPKGVERGSTTLHLTASEGHVEALQVILPHSDTVICNDDGDTSMHLSAANHHCDVLQLLLPYSEANATNKFGMTALAYIFEKDVQQCEKKRENGEENRQMEVPEKKDIKMIKLLMLHADANVVDNEGRTAFRLAASLRWFNIKKLFLPHLDVTSLGIQATHEDAVEALS
ncbi:uncharacterized protein LOC135376054 [Ornithodoros turicata]|uniref:uncharacterized protein LOC135376054 n=1 Tax=Ornithodoros turicata TaxID=34597 RepID=UPI003138B641